MKKIERLMVANRGEIALRVVRTCKEMGIETVTLYTAGEEQYPHALESDYALFLGDGPLSETYLNRGLIIELALKHGVDAIHPGYGFLSENAAFAELCHKKGIIFVGPPVECIRLMGDKQSSKIRMEKLNIPLIPGYHGDQQDVVFLKEKANKIGYPILLKASAGGGGKGMRIVHQESEFEDQLRSARREAKSAFGDDKILLEKFIENPRHIEIQVMSDSRGNHYHLFERECSIQRRYQKIIEESPSVALTPDLRAKMGEVATKITSSIGYEGAGTVEFIMGEDKKFYFLEMNTRLQVEHPVTELVTGFDLVRCQIDVARGLALGWKQEELRQNGHSIEMRIYAEDPENSFLPQVGTLHKIGEVTRPGVRIDSAHKDGDKITVNFDPMLAKIVVHAGDREKCIQKALACLEEFPFAGVKTNRAFLARVLSLSQFADGEIDTHFIEKNREELFGQVDEEDERLLKAKAIAAFLLMKSVSAATENGRQAGGPDTPWGSLSGFRLGGS